MDNSAQLAEMVRDELEEQILRSRNSLETGFTDSNMYWKEVGRLNGYRLAINAVKDALHKLTQEELEDDDE